MTNGHPNHPTTGMMRRSSDRRFQRLYRNEIAVGRALLASFKTGGQNPRYVSTIKNI